MKRFFDEETGILLLDEAVSNHPGFQAIVEDKMVSDAEIISQAETVIQYFKKIDEQLSEPDKKLVLDAIAELCVLYQINIMKEAKTNGSI
ncbi:MAG: hypothetical protein Q4C12_08325 [Clostridia bacterium]|nr:hypothetical protein [Clostridia bacterium]